MNYYRVISPDKGENIMMKRSSHRRIHTTSGQYIDPKELQLPFEIEMHVGEDYGYDQYDPFFEGEIPVLTLEERLNDYYHLPSIMTLELFKALKSAGANNLQAFPTKIINAKNDEILEKDYLFINIVGVLSCADLSASKKAAIGDSFYIHDLIIDKSKQINLPIFRLKESHFEIIVNETVSQAIREGNFSGIDIEKIN
ncbi:MAG: hypothetical protein H6622_08980 [Halobacteriovoraceae bacterium]|nr:hypothetical protein [Halobacteriovoraceae bacterium]